MPTQQQKKPEEITMDSLQESLTLDLATPSESSKSGTGVIDSILKSFVQTNQQTQKLEGEGDAINTRLEALTRSLGGEGVKTQKLQTAAGVPEKQKQFQASLSKLRGFQLESQGLENQYNLAPARVQQESPGALSRAATQARAAGEQRNIALRQADITSQALREAATAYALQGDITLANQQISAAIDAEFEPQRIELQVAQLNYTRNKDALDRIDKKRFNELGILLNERTRLLAIAEADKKEIYDVAKIVAQYGAPADIASKIGKATSREEALAIAAPYLQDPKAKIDLQNAVLSGQLTRLNINKTAYELDLLKKYGGLTPTQYADKLKEEQKAIAAAKDEKEKARLLGASLGAKATLLGTVLNSSAINSVVGPSFTSRAATGFGGFLGRFAAGAAAGGAVGAGVGLAGGPFAPVTVPIGVIGGALIGGTALASQGSVDYFTGASDALIGQTEQFISKEFLQNLIDVKAQGATFGALQKAEQDALTASATYIGQRRISQGTGEDKRVMGYDMSEADFRRELTNIQNITRIAYERATGESWSPDENAAWEALEQSQSAVNFNPAY